jgi:hypothetical protein
LISGSVPVTWVTVYTGPEECVCVGKLTGFKTRDQWQFGASRPPRQRLKPFPLHETPRKESFVSSIINQSRYIVKIARRPDFTREFPHAKSTEAEAYKATLSAEDQLDGKAVSQTVSGY